MTLDHPENRGPILLAATLSSFLTAFMGSAVNLSLPAVASEFAMGAVTLTWVSGSYLLAAAMFLLPAGRLADLHGRKRVFLIGSAVNTAATALCALAWSGPALLSLRFVQGAGAALVFATGVAMVTSAFPPGERGRALGINVSAVYLGLSVGPFAGGMLTGSLGWRSIFAVCVPMGLAVLAVVFARVRGEWAEAKGERFDLPGALLYGAALAALMGGATLLPAARGGAVMAAGLALLVLFCLRENGRPSPLLDMRLFLGNAVFAFSSLAALVNYSATFAVGFLMSLYLQYARGLDPRQAGLVLLAQPAMMALFSPLAGRLSDRIEPRVVASAGMALTTIGLALLTLQRPEGALGWTVACLALLGFGFALFSAPNTNAIMSSVERRQYGVASSALGTMRLLGQMVSMGVVTVLFALLLGGKAVCSDNQPMFLLAVRTALGLFAALCLAGTFASMARGKLRG